MNLDGSHPVLRAETATKDSLRSLARAIDLLDDGELRDNLVGAHSIIEQCLSGVTHLAEQAVAR